MKKHLLIISSFLLVVLTALVVVACGGNDKKNQDVSVDYGANPQKNLVGTWKMVSGKDYEQITLNANHQGTRLSYIDYYKELYTDNFSWSYDAANDLLTVILIESEYGYLTQLVFKVQWFGDNQIFVTLIDGYDAGELMGPFNRQ